jgi:hypothetical protein
MSPTQLRALRYIEKYRSTRGGVFAKNTIQSLKNRGLIAYDFDRKVAGGYDLTDAGRDYLKGHRP